MMGSVPWPMARFPIIAESDFAGTVVDANGHSEWAVGQGTLATVRESDLVGSTS